MILPGAGRGRSARSGPAGPGPRRRPPRAGRRRRPAGRRRRPPGGGLPARAVRPDPRRRPARPVPAHPGEPAARGPRRRPIRPRRALSSLPSGRRSRSVPRRRDATGAHGRRPAGGRTAGPPTIASLWAEVSGRGLTRRRPRVAARRVRAVGTVLRRTHVYRFAVSPPAGPALAAPAAAVRGTRRLRRRRGVGGLGGGRRRARRRPWWPTPGGPCGTARRRRSTTSPTARHWPVCEALLILLAVSDETCAGVAAALDPDARRPATGSAPGSTNCSRAPDRCPACPPTGCGCCPKVRTPPGGISFRSLSRYLCLRGPGGRRRLAQGARPGGRASASSRPTCCCCPWPLRVRQRDFRPLSGSVHRAENEPFGTFEFAPAEPFDLDLVERVLRGALDEVDARRRGRSSRRAASRSTTSSRWRRCSAGTG